MYLFISSEDSNELNPANTSYDFTVTLPQTINGSFEIALAEMTYTSHNEDLYVFCDLCEHSFVKDSMLPILRAVTGVGGYQNLFYHKVTRNSIQRVRIFITNKKLEHPSQDIGPVHLLLILRSI